MQDPSAPAAIQSFQLSYGKYLRDPANESRPEGIPPRRSEIYENLLYNNISGFIDKCFPVAMSMFDEGQWRKLTRSFFRDWRSETPIFSQIPYEFVRFIAETEIKNDLPPWLPELLHYEWVELEVDLRENACSENLASQEICTNPSLKVLAYQWPVHKISKTFQPDTPAETCLAVYRDEHLKVRFLEINATTFMLLQFIQMNPGIRGEILQAFAEQLKHPEPSTLISFGQKIIDDFISQEIIIGGNT